MIRFLKSLGIAALVILGIAFCIVSYYLSAIAVIVILAFLVAKTYYWFTSSS